MSKYIQKHLATVDKWREQRGEQAPSIKNQKEKQDETQQPKIKIKR